MKNIFLQAISCLSISLVLASQSFAQGPPDKPADLDDAQVIAKYAATITPQDLKAHLEFLASDELEGRETASRGQHIAGKYIAAQFARLGLKPPVIENGKFSHFQTFALESSEVKSASISFSSKQEFKLMEDFFAFSRRSFSSDIQGEFVFVGYGIQEDKYDNLGNTMLEGKVGVVLGGEPVDEKGNYLLTGNDEPSEWTSEFRKKRLLLQSKGASAMLVILEKEKFKRFVSSRWVKGITKGRSLNMAADRTDPPIPMIYISEEMGDALFKKNKMKLEEVRNHLNKYALIPEPSFKKVSFSMKVDSEVEMVNSENVLGYLEGSGDTEELLVITGHYDHLGVKGDDIYNGADDDGSGTVSVLEIAEAFSKAAEEGYRPRRSILFMTVSGEEKGLLGSRFYTEHPVFSLENTVCNLNIDMIGRVDEKHAEDENYVYIIGSDRLSSDLHEINEFSNEEFSQLDLDYEYNEEDDPNRFYYRSDHYNFAKNGIPVIFYFTGVHEDYHKPTDTIDKIRFEKMSNIAELVFVTAWKVANRDKRIVVDGEVEE